MSRRCRFFLVLLLVVAAVPVSCCLFRSAATVPKDYVDAGRPTSIDPDYTDCTIPPNIAPLNFTVKEEGVEYRVKVYSEQGSGFLVSSSTGAIVMPDEAWRALLDRSRGHDLHFDVYVREEDGRWRRFPTITNRIARERIDPYLVYRRLKPVHNVYTNMGTHQRELSTFRESPVLLNDPDSRRCVNCHTFVNNRPETMILHVRGDEGSSMILAQDGTAAKIDTRTDFNIAPAAYASWHPSGRLAAFAAIQVVQLHHAVGGSRDVFDHDSDLGVYLADSNTVTTTPGIARPDRLETFPCWSPDGKHLYFCSAPRLWEEGLKEKRALPLNFDRARYDLMRIGYDNATGTWSEPETVLSAEQTGWSILEPRVSPDGRFLLFCMCRYGSFPVFQRSSDLYMMDLATREHWPLKINSERSDSWHCWSSNSRWIVYASKRRDGLFGRLYFSYIDDQGRAHKPVMLPQEDPAFYDSFMGNFNAPELITGPVGVEQEELVRAIRSPQTQDATFVGELPYVSNSDNRGPKTRIPRKIIPSDLVEAGRCYRLAQAAEANGQPEKAVEYYRRSLERWPKIHPGNILAAGSLARIYATDPSDQSRNGDEAVRLAKYALWNADVLAQQGPDARTRQGAQAARPAVLRTLAAAYAECGQFIRAVETGFEAETTALQQGQLDLALEIRRHLENYLLDQPYRDRQ